MKMMLKSSMDDANIDSSSKLFLSTFWQKIQNKPTANASGFLIYIQPLPGAGVLVRGDWEHFRSLTSVYLALIQTWSK